MNKLDQLLVKYNAVLLTATDAELQLLEADIAKAKAQLARDNARIEAAEALKQAEEVKARAKAAKSHSDKANSLAGEVQAKLNNFVELSAQLIKLGNELSNTDAVIREELRLAKHYGIIDNRIRYAPIKIGEAFTALKIANNISERSYL